MIKEGVMISGRYEVMGRIGTGGMADVYKAIDRMLNRYVAVKVLKSEFREDEMFVRKFRSEAQAAAGLLHPNIVNVYDVGEDCGLYYIVMELVEGITLKEYIQKKGKLTSKEAIAIAMQVCLGLDVAHSNGIVHRDIKPQNIIISKEGKVKVTDFGIAKATSSNTISTNAMGSVHYTSPEQARGGFSDVKSDIYSLGITMYEMVTGILPFDGDSTVSIALKHLQEDMVAPSEHVPELPYSLEQIILKCTQKSADRRYPDVNSLARDLKRSVQEPDGDFVKIAPAVSMADTVMITEDDLAKIQNSAPAEQDYDDYDEYDEYDEYERKRAGKKRSEIDPKMAKVMKILAIVVAVIFAFVLIFAVGKSIGLIKFGPGIQESTNMYEVPELVGKTLEEAEELCEKQGLVLKVTEKKESESYEEGYVTDQKTQAGTKLQEGAYVQVVVSSGLKGKEIVVPEVIGKTQSTAIELLVAAGFLEENITITEVESSEVDAGKVVFISPEEKSTSTAKAEIVLEVSKGKGTTTVPSLVGKTKDEAIRLIEEAELVISVEEVYSDKTAGQVISQEIEAGTKVDKGTAIKVQVSKGTEMVKVPTGLVGNHKSNVEATLKNLGFKVEAAYSSSTQYAYDYVIGVEGEGQTVEKGTTIVIEISTGPGPQTTPSTPPDNPGSGEE